jgi:hypothetical protein
MIPNLEGQKGLYMERHINNFRSSNFEKTRFLSKQKYLVMANKVENLMDQGIPNMITYFRSKNTWFLNLVRHQVQHLVWCRDAARAMVTLVGRGNIRLCHTCLVKIQIIWNINFLLLCKWKTYLFKTKNKAPSQNYDSKSRIP